MQGGWGYKCYQILQRDTTISLSGVCRGSERYRDEHNFVALRLLSTMNCADYSASETTTGGLSLSLRMTITRLRRKGD